MTMENDLLPQDFAGASDGMLPTTSCSLPSASGISSESQTNAKNMQSDTPETDSESARLNGLCHAIGSGTAFVEMEKHARKIERERNEEMGFRSQWCDKARKAEAALDALEDLTRELAATKKTLGTLIAWSVVELGEENTQRLLNMMSPVNS